MGPGENAGAVDVGDGVAIAFKVESHNHPSAVEPFQGAATGVGGILRDVFAVGARPIAILDSLRFGELESPRSLYLLDGAVSGIGHYGNSIGVPTIGGEVYFEGAYESNCLVNAMCLGIADHDRLTRSAAAGVGNLLVLMGARTGRDGIGGASVLASAELDTEDDSKRPTVQIGDPFEEKRVMEACLELLDRGTLTSLQDLGAAGLSSSSSEMASGGQVGLDIDVSKVPLREDDMEPFEIMISESQERMLCVIEPHKLEELTEVCDRWEVRSSVIGQVTDSRHLRILHGDEVVGDMPVDALVDDCPLYDLEPAAPETQIYAAPAAHAGGRRPRGGAARAAGLGQPVLAPAAVRAVRPDRAVAHGAPARGGRRRGAAPLPGHRLAAGHRGVHRRQRPPGGLRPLHRHGRGGAGVRRQPGLRRRRAAGPDQLPQLRQPREAARGVAAAAVGGRHDRRARGHRRAGGGRQRLALQRVRRRADLPHAGGGHGRRGARRGRHAGLGLRRRRRPDRAGPARGVRGLRGRLGAGQAARRGAAAGPAGRSTSRP